MFGSFRVRRACAFSGLHRIACNQYWFIRKHSLCRVCLPGLKTPVFYFAIHGRYNSSLLTRADSPLLTPETVKDTRALSNEKSIYVYLRPHSNRNRNAPFHSRQRSRRSPRRCCSRGGDCRLSRGCWLCGDVLSGECMKV